MHSRYNSTRLNYYNIKQQIKDNQNPQIDKMNNLNPCICEWLHGAWKQMQGMEEIIVKGSDKIGNTKAFKDEFHIFIMEASATTSLFSVTPNIEEYGNGINKNGSRSTRSNFDNNGKMFTTSKHNHNINCNYK
jgi:hypothetical protein